LRVLVQAEDDVLVDEPDGTGRLLAVQAEVVQWNPVE
jgi:hypothetical protein